MSSSSEIEKPVEPVRVHQESLDYFQQNDIVYYLFALELQRQGKLEIIPAASG